MIDVSALPRVKFDDDHHGPILRGGKTATVRIGDAGEGLDPGDPFVVVGPDDEQWCVVTTRARIECTVAQAPLAIEAFGARYPHDHPAEIAVTLERYYDRVVDFDDDVRVVIWGPPYV